MWRFIEILRKNWKKCKNWRCTIVHNVFDGKNKVFERNYNWSENWKGSNSNSSWFLWACENVLRSFTGEQSLFARELAKVRKSLSRNIRASQKFSNELSASDKNLNYTK